MNDSFEYPPEIGAARRVVSADEEARHRRAKFWRRAFIGLVVAAMAALFTFSAYGIYAIRQTQTSNSPVIRTIKDCTEVGGDCYKRGQKQTANTLASAQKIIVLAAACAIDVTAEQTVSERVQSITGCIARRLADTPTPTS